MRWEALFADLDAQLDAAAAAELAAEVSDRSRRELARVRLADRAGAAVGAQLTVALGAAGTVSGRLRRSGPGWWLLATLTGELLVATDACTWVAGLPGQAADPGSIGAVEGRLGLGYVLRGLARDRSPVAVTLRDGTGVTGTLDRVGADFVDLAEHDAGEPRRAGSVRSGRTLPFSALAMLRPS